MPKIDVYKHNGVAIPVDVAVRSKGYICPWTNELYLTKKTYVKHLNTLRVNRMHRRAREIRHRKKLEDLWNQPSFDKIINWIELNPDVFWKIGSGMDINVNWRNDRWNAIRDKFEIKITHLSLDYSDSVSNSHSCPHNGMTNWGGDKLLKDGTPAPTGYPGYRGRIEWEFTTDIPGFCSDLFRNTRIHTGSGGGGALRGSYEVRFFLDDWPGIKQAVEEERLKFEKENLLKTIKTGFSPYFSMPGYTYGKARR